MEAEKAMKQELLAAGNGNLRKIAIYHFYYDWSWADIARKLGMKVSTVKMRWKRFHEKECRTQAAMAGGYV